MKKLKDSGKKSYHEIMEEVDDKKGFKRSDLPRKRKETSSRDDEPLVSMAKSEASQRRGYDDRRPQGPKKEFRKPYTSGDQDEKKPYDPNRPKREYDPNRPPRPYDPDRPKREFDPNKPARPYDPNRPKREFDPNRPPRPYDPDRPKREFDPNKPARPYDPNRPKREYDPNKPKREYDPNRPKRTPPKPNEDR